MADAKITDIKLMVLRDPDTPPWNLVRVDTDQGVWGLGEAYWGWGLRPIIEHQLKPLLIGENPLDVDRLYTKMTHQWAGGHSLSGLVVTAITGVEIALWDLAGKLTGLPVYRLLGGKFRDRVRMYRTGMPDDILSLASCQEYAARIREQGWTAIKTADVESLGLRYDPQYKEVGHERMSRRLTALDLKRAEKAMENLRIAFGEDFDIAVHCHWAFDLRDAIELAKCMAPYRPIWLEDPLPPQFSPAWVRLTEVSEVPICTGENLYTRHEFRPFIEQHGLDDMADVHYIPTCAHNASSIVGYVASAHCAVTIRDFGMMERGGYDWPWFEDLVIHDKPIFQNGYIHLPEGPGLGLTLNPDVVKAHLAPGEQYWGD